MTNISLTLFEKQEQRHSHHSNSTLTLYQCNEYHYNEAFELH